MIYPKQQRKKKRKKHKPSILHRKDGTCYICMLDGDYSRRQYTEEHHIFGGPNRQISEAEGLKVYLCREHHTAGPGAVHNNADNMKRLRQIGQRAYEETHTRQQFMERFGKNYIDD